MTESTPRILIEHPTEEDVRMAGHAGAHVGALGNNAPQHLREQPRPVENRQPAVWDLVMRDMEARDRFGAAKYGTRLQPHNGRDALSDAYQEALDLCVYLRSALFERDGK